MPNHATPDHRVLIGRAGLDDAEEILDLQKLAYITGVLFNPEQERCADAAVLEIRMNDEPTDKARIAVYRPLTEPITLPFSTDLRKTWFPNSSRISWRV